MAKQKRQPKKKAFKQKQKKRTSRVTLEQTRKVMNALLRGEIDVASAAEILQRSTRQIYRIKAKLRAHGAKALIHGNTGRRASNKIGHQTWEAVIDLARTAYSGIAFAELAEILAKRHNLQVGRESLRKQLRAAGISPKRDVRRKKETSVESSGD